MDNYSLFDRSGPRVRDSRGARVDVDRGHPEIGGRRAARRPRFAEEGRNSSVAAAAPDHKTGPQGHVQGPGRAPDERRERREGYFCGF